MELRHIRYFLAVAEEKSITRGAEKVGIGQPPLSLQIKDLETEVGARLFHRVPSGVELTAAGAAFLQSVASIPDQVERAMHSAQRAARGEQGALRIGFTASSTFNPVVADAIRRFRRGYPDVYLSMEELNTTRLIEALNQGELDAVFLRPGAYGTEDLQFRLLSEEPLLLVLPAQHPLARRGALKLADLAREPFIMFPRENGTTLFDTVILACRSAGFSTRVGQTAPQISSIIHLVAAELGVSLVPASMKQLQVKGVVYRQPEDVSPSVKLSLAWRRGDASPFLKNFLGCALQ